MTGQELSDLRHKLGLTQKQMGEKLGITLSAVFKLESGENNMSKPVSILCQQLENLPRLVVENH
jgi:transcriptional regulator with XRE-family HTH domain